MTEEKRIELLLNIETWLNAIEGNENEKPNRRQEIKRALVEYSK